MITVYRYTLENWKKNVCRLILPVGAEILKTIWYDNKQIELWAKVDTAAAEEVCYFYVVKTGENITKRLEQRDKSKKLDYIGDFWDGGNVHWFIFKAAIAYSSSSIIGHYWGTNLQPLTANPSWALCGNNTSGIIISSCCDNNSESNVALTNSDSALTVNKIDVNTVED